MLITRQDLDSQLPSGEPVFESWTLPSMVGDLGLLASGSAWREIATGRFTLVQNGSPRSAGTR